MKNLILIFLIIIIAPLANATGLDYLLNGATTPVKVDTVTPGNSRAYPFSYYNTLGVRVDLGTESTLQTINTNVLGVNTTLQGIDFATQTTLAALNAKFGSLGQKPMADSAPVVISSDQSSLPVTV